MATTTYALYASASFHGEVVEESFVRGGQPLQIGNSPTLAVPVPAGCPYIARVLWTGPSTCAVQDGLGNVHHLEPGQDVVIELGPVTLRLYLVEQFRIRRAQPWSVRGSIAWLAVVMMSTVLTMQYAWVDKHFCEIVMVLLPQEVVAERFWYCLPETADSGGGSPLTAEYLARLLREDYDGEDKGVISEEIERPDAERKIDPENPKKFFLPAGNEGPITKMGGAEETALEPVRSAEDEDLPVPQKATQEEVPLYAEDVGTPIPQPVAEDKEPDDGVAEGLEDVDSEDTEPAVEPPAEEEEGWGIPDWYDEEDEAIEELEIELMLRVAKRRLKIDPDDAQALSLLSYYQYLAQDYDSALKTYDRFIELYPENAAGYNNKALVYKRLGQYEKEEGLYRVALSYEPLDVTAMNNLAVNLAHQGRFEEALAVMDQLLSLDPDDPYAHLHRSKIHAEMGNDDEALVYLRKALEGMRRLDTLHHIEFRQDIRIDPSFERLRQTYQFRAILNEFYGKDSPLQE